MKRHKLTQAGMAERFGVCQATISKLLKRERYGWPHGAGTRYEYAKNIEKLSGGAIKASYLLKISCQDYLVDKNKWRLK